MCGAFGFTGKKTFKSQEELKSRYQLNNSPELQDLFNIRPSMKALVITRNSPNTGKLLNYGIKASWDEKKLLINAKSETVSTLRTFKNLFLNNRCLVPASYFFEWKRLEDGKIPYCIRVKVEKSISFAGLHTDNGFVILTTKPNKLMEDIHNRMPVILHRDDEDRWLDPKSSEGTLTDLFAPFPEKEMEAYPVSSLVNSPKNQSDAILRKAKI